MKNLWLRLGVIPYFIFGVGLAVIGIMAANFIVDNWYPFDVGRLDLLRDTALDRAVLSAYGWPPDLDNEEILAHLLALNLARAEKQSTINN